MLCIVAPHAEDNLKTRWIRSPFGRTSRCMPHVPPYAARDRERSGGPGGQFTVRRVDALAPVGDSGGPVAMLSLE